MKQKKAYVIMNETHSLLPEQEEILNNSFETWEIIDVPSKGWTLEEMEEIASNLHVKANQENAIVFVSPVPFLIKTLTLWSIGHDNKILYNVFIFHNDRREKKELPDGRIIQVIAQTGWKLI